MLLDVSDLPPLPLLESTFLREEKYTSKSWRVIGGWGLDAPRMPGVIDLENLKQLIF